MEIIKFLLLSLTFFFLGRYTATNKDVDQAKQLFKRTIKDRVGTVRRPTAEDIAKRGTKLEETEEAMEETLDKIVK